MLEEKDKIKVALVLGGGAARGLAHIGVLKVLQAENIPIDMVVGTSIGSLLGAAYALDVPLEKIEQKALSFTVNDLLDISISRMGLAAGNKLDAFIESILDAKTFQDARIPIAIITTNIETGQKVIYTSGKLKDVVRASCSIPGVYKPVELDGKLLVDGGLVDNVPVKVAKDMGANRVIAVDVGYCIKKGHINNLLGVLMQSIQIMGEELNVHQAKDADIIIKPNLKDIDQLSFDRAKEAIELGETAALAVMANLKQLLRIGHYRWMNFLWE